MIRRLNRKMEKGKEEWKHTKRQNTRKNRNTNVGKRMDAKNK
jgi:hypothetical protein